METGFFSTQYAVNALHLILAPHPDSFLERVSKSHSMNEQVK